MRCRATATASLQFRKRQFRQAYAYRKFAFIGRVIRAAAIGIWLGVAVGGNIVSIVIAFALLPIFVLAPVLRRAFRILRSTDGNSKQRSGAAIISMLLRCTTAII